MRWMTMLGCALAVACGGDTVETATPVIDDDGDGFAVDEDCDDGDPDVNPDAEEICDEVDNDCDGEVDDGVALISWPDLDGDGWGDASAPRASCEVPSDDVSNGFDCDDGDHEIGPDALELCDGLDNNCDGLVDEPRLALDFDGPDGADAVVLSGGAFHEMNQGYIGLTPSSNQVGAAFLAVELPSRRWVAHFDLRMTAFEDEGGEGMTFAWLDEHTSPEALGYGGADLGFYGLPGYAVEFDTVDSSDGDPNNNHLSAGSGSGYLYGTAAEVLELQSGEWIPVTVEFDQNQVVVRIDGYPWLDEAMPVPEGTMTHFGFTAATSGDNASHDVDNLVIGFE
jgi:hypothetical protein